MAIVTTDNRHYKNIANAIRDTGSYEGPIPPSQMAELISESCQTAKQMGKQEEYDCFWDAYQQNGTRVCYDIAFGMPWTPDTFRPKYDIVANSTNSMFKYFSYDYGVASLKQLLLNAGVSLILQNPYNFSFMFESSKISEIGELDFSTATRKNQTAVFQNCKYLVTIDKVTLPTGQTTFNNWFYECVALENVIFAGVIDANNFDIHWSTKLTHDSLMSIINCLADRSGQAPYTVTLGTENLGKLTDAEKAMATQKGWTLA